MTLVSLLNRFLKGRNVLFDEKVENRMHPHWAFSTTREYMFPCMACWCPKSSLVRPATWPRIFLRIYLLNMPWRQSPNSCGATAPRRTMKRRGILKLDSDVLLRIFGILPPKSLARCAAVCSSWHNVIASNSSLWEYACGKQVEELAAKFGLTKTARQGVAKTQAIAMEQHARLVYGSTSIVPWEAHSGRVNCCRWVMDTIATGSSDNTVKIWSISSSRCVEQYRVPRNVDVIDIEIDESKVLGAAGTDVYIWKRDRSQTFRKLGGHQRLYSMCYMDPELAVGCEDGTIRTFDLYSGHCSLIFRHHTEPVTRITLSTSLHLLASASNDGTVQLCDPTSGEKVAKYAPTQPSGISCAHMLQNGLKLVAGTGSGDLYCWDLRAGKMAPLWKARVSNNVNCMHYQEYGPSVIVVGGHDGCLGIIKSDDGEVLARYTTRRHTSPVLSVRVGTTRAVSCHADGTVTLWKFDLSLNNIN